MNEWIGGRRGRKEGAKEEERKEGVASGGSDLPPAGFVQASAVEGVAQGTCSPCRRLHQRSVIFISSLLSPLPSYVVLSH